MTIMMNMIPPTSRTMLEKSISEATWNSLSLALLSEEILAWRFPDFKGPAKRLNVFGKSLAGGEVL